ncbi:hypothetical protein [Gemmata sp.]|uniref:hypothetical protein n=1 Tax=Gemmata sp. TaxID=1914242 RepID=UPI003F702AA8
MLPAGVMVRHAAWGDTSHLIVRHRLLAWSAAGYTGQVARPDDLEVEVLTPEATVRAIRAGDAPDLHHTASRWV